VQSIYGTYHVNNLHGYIGGYLKHHLFANINNYYHNNYGNQATVKANVSLRVCREKACDFSVETGYS